MDDKAIKDWLIENNIQEVETIVPDMAGTARGKLIPIENSLQVQSSGFQSLYLLNP